MGRTFHVPKRRDRERWETVQALYAHGFRFFSHGSYPQATPLPERLKEVSEFVRQHPHHPFRVGPVRPDLLPRSHARRSQG